MPRKGADRELLVGSSAHYVDAALYTSTYADRDIDVRFYVNLARGVGRVLEYGCGNGRIAIPMARAGVSVTGIDQSATMLGDLRRRLRDEPTEVRARVRAHAFDMRARSVPGRATFPLVLCTFNTFLHLYTRDDVERFLARVRGHLAREGRFVFDTSVPSPIDLARLSSKPFRFPPVRHPNGRRYRYQERFDYEPMRQVLFVGMEFEADDHAFVTPLAHRQFFPAELEALLHYNGLEVTSRAGGFKGEPADRHADSLVWTCRARRGFSR